MEIDGGDSIRTELVDLTDVSLTELMESQDPALLASMARVVERALRESPAERGMCGPDTCGF